MCRFFRAILPRWRIRIQAVRHVALCQSEAIVCDAVLIMFLGLLFRSEMEGRTW